MTDILEIVRRALASDTSGGADDPALFHPDAEWVVAREHPDAATHHGHAAIRAYLEEWSRTLGSLRFEPDRFLDGAEEVVVVGRVRGVGLASGAEIEIPLALVATVRGGLITRIEEYLDPDEALRAVGGGE